MTDKKVEAFTPPVSRTEPMVAMIERIVMDPSIPIDRLEQMLAMKERMDARAAEVAFNESFAAFQLEVPKVIARHKNDQTRSKYATLADIYEVAKPIATAHGFSFSTFPAPSAHDGYQGIRWTLRHSAGHSISDIAEVPSDATGMKGNANKTATHAFGSTASYGRRYIFCMVFDIATEDDNDGNSRAQPPQKINADQFVAMQGLIEETGADVPKLLKFIGAETLEELTLRQFDTAMSALRKKQAQKGAGQ